MRERASIAIEAAAKIFTTPGRGAIHALAPTDLLVSPGEFVAIVGPSGCGKTTLMRMVAGLLRPSAGRVSVGGQRVDGPRPDVGVVFQQALLLPWLKVETNAVLPLDIQGRRQRKDGAKVRELLRMVGLEGFESRLPRELSGGMQQRVALARALVHDPSVLLMDEPFGALDAMTRETMNIELQRIWAADRKTVLFITHSIPEAVFLADRVVVMSPRPGRIEAILDVHFARPRTTALFNHPEFGRLTQRIRAMFGIGAGEGPNADAAVLD